MLKLASLTGCRGKAVPMGWAEERPLVQWHQLCAEGRKASLEVGRQQPTSVARDRQDGRLTSISLKGATSQQGARPGCKLIWYASSTASGSNPHPQDQARSPVLSTGRSHLSTAQPLGQG